VELDAVAVELGLMNQSLALRHLVARGRQRRHKDILTALREARRGMVVGQGALERDWRPTDERST
jgi:hypothetical protein